MDDYVIDDILLLILQGIDSPVSLVRAASTCKRWHRIIADAGFLRRFRSLHAPTLVAGDYFNYSKRSNFILKLGKRFTTPRPSFAPPAASSSPIHARHFSLDFLFDVDGGDGTGERAPSWTIHDSRGSLLLLYRNGGGPLCNGVFLDVAICEPVTRSYKRIPPPPKYTGHYCRYTGSYLIAGEVGGSIDMSNFRVLHMFEHLVSPLDQRTGTATFTVCGSTGSSSWGDWTPMLAVVGSSGDDDVNDQDLVHLHYLGGAGGSHYFYATGRNLLVLDGSTGEFSHAVFPPPSVSWAADFDIHVTSSMFYVVAGGRDGKPRIFTVFDETMKVYARSDGGEWMLQKSLSLPEASRALPGYKEEFFSEPYSLKIHTRGPGYVIISAKTGLDKWLISVDMETMQVTLAAAEDTGPVMYRCEIPWPLVLNNV